MSDEAPLTYSVDVSFRCRRLTQEQGAAFWEYADHFAAERGKWKNTDRTVYRWQTRLTGPRITMVIANALSIVRESAKDEDVEFLSLTLELQGVDE